MDKYQNYIAQLKEQVPQIDYNTQLLEIEKKVKPAFHLDRLLLASAVGALAAVIVLALSLSQPRISLEEYVFESNNSANSPVMAYVFGD